MNTANGASPISSHNEPDLPKRLLRPFTRALQTGKPAATVDRLFCSQHVSDLRLIVAFALFGVYLVCAIGLPLSFESTVVTKWSIVASRKTDWVFVHLFFMAMDSFFTFFTPVVAVFGAILAWAYQTGSRRLGVVDLFACEIGTVCRVATIVDTVRQSVDTFNQGPQIKSAGMNGLPALPHQFTSQENYLSNVPPKPKV